MPTIHPARKAYGKFSLLLALALGTNVAVAQQGGAQAAPAAPPPEVKVTTTLLGGNVYGIDGQGGRMAALVGPEGVFLVDAQFAPVTEKIVAAIKQLTQAPLRFLVNTHVHGDHTGGNENFAKLGVTILGRPNLREQLLSPRPGANGQVPPVAPPMALPIVMYDNPTTVYLNGETVQLIPLQPSHTNGDTAVKFVNADVLMTGDVFRSEGFPAAAITNGGDIMGLLDVHRAVHRALRPEHEGRAGSRARHEPRRARRAPRFDRHGSRQGQRGDQGGQDARANSGGAAHAGVRAKASAASRSSSRTS